jgi:hypothetical protein
MGGECFPALVVKLRRICESSSSVSPSMLERLKERDAQAWTRVVLLYHPLVCARCRQVGLAEGSTITVGAFKFRISYVGGAGHDVTLTSI